MGLNLKNSLVTVKEEASEGCKDSGFFKNSPVQWPMSSTFEPSNPKFQTDIKKNVNGMPQFSITPFSGGQQKVVHPVAQRANHVSSLNLTNPFFRTQMSGQSIKQSAPATAEPWINSKAACNPTQMTIFYGGTVNVFEGISPEKAQAIMFLAGNACSIGQNTRGKGVNGEDVAYTPPCSAISSPLSVSSHPKTTSPLDSTKMPTATSIAHLSALIPSGSAVPQARKASLARFLEKRKERAMGAAPYNPGKINGEAGTSQQGFLGVSFSGTPGMGSGTVSAANS